MMILTTASTATRQKAARDAGVSFQTLRSAMNISHNEDDKIAFLGVCERAAYVREGNTNLFKWNVLGLKQILLSYLFPFPLRGIGIGFAFQTGVDTVTDHRFQLTDESGKEIGTISISTEIVSAEAHDAASMSPSSQGLNLPVPEHGWLIMFFSLDDSKIVIEKPGLYYVRRITDEGPRTIGQLFITSIDAPPLTPDRIAAIRSDPNASKAVRLELGCSHCPTKYRVYAALDRSEKSEGEGWVWYLNMPDRFVCGCGKTNLDLALIRRNLHGLLGQRRQERDDPRFIPLYEKSSLENVRASFSPLLASRGREELLQQFINENPVLLHQFPAERLFPKPPILTFFVADFAIVTPQRELLLIELEKSTTRLLKKDGDVASELNHAFDQVRNWLHVVNEHRLAFLDSLKIEKEQVSSVKGVVIAGRDAGYDAHHLRKLKGSDLGRITFLTYDDLGFALDALIRRIEAL